MDPDAYAFPLSYRYACILTKLKKQKTSYNSSLAALQGVFMLFSCDKSEIDMHEIVVLEFLCIGCCERSGQQQWKKCEMIVTLKTRENASRWRGREK